MIRIVLSVVLALGIGGVAYAAADGLDISNQPFAQTGGTDDLTCDNAVQVYMTSVGFPPIVDTVTVGGINSACIGANIKVILTIDNVWVAEQGTGPIANDFDKQLDFSGDNIDFELVNDVHVVIQGGSAP